MRHQAGVRSCSLLGLVLAVGLVACGGSKEEGFDDRVAAEHAGDRPVASPGAQLTPGAPIVTREVEYAVLDGTTVQGYLARPVNPSENTAGILVIHEWWGLNDNIRAMAGQLAGEGYVALAVDLYEGQVAETPEQARALMSATNNRQARLDNNLRQAHAYLSEQPGVQRIGVIGWCFGGGWSLRTALLLGDGIDATVIYYGHLITDPQELAALRSPVLGLFGDQDGSIPVDTVHAFEQGVTAAGQPVTVRIYPGAGHAFANPSGTRYDASAAEDAWARTRTFLAEYLKPAGA